MPYQSLYVPYISGFTKLIVIGGYNYDYGGELSSTEVIDLRNPSSTCHPIADFPIEDYGMAAAAIDGVVKACGSHYVPSTDCYDYDPLTNSWISSASLLHPKDLPRASFIDNIWLVSGDSFDDGDDAYSTTEIWTGSTFESGPSLPVNMSYPCQLTVNSTHVFFAENHDSPSYLLDWYSGTWTELAPMNEQRDSYYSCGLINSPRNGPEVVTFEFGITEIFNIGDGTWRAGPPTEEVFYVATAAQLTDTFALVGGFFLGDDLDSIYMFDPYNYEWKLMSQKLEVARYFAAVAAVPDEFFSCQ